MESFGFLRNVKENPAGRPRLPGGLFDITGGLFDITDDLLIKQKDRTPAKLQASGHQIKRARDGDRTRKGKIPGTRINTGMLINTTLPGYQK